MAREHVVKSVGRVFEVLEFFDYIQRPATTMEISKALAIPQSSTSALLRSMVILGYCLIDPARRTYAPTARVSLLGAWLSAPLVENGSLIRMLHEVADKTGEHILLAALSGHQVRYIYSIPARIEGRPAIRAGTMRPLGRSGAGNLFLSMRSDPQIARLIRRVNAEARGPADRVDLKALMAEIETIRSSGYGVAFDKMAQGIGGVNILLPRMARMQPMAVAISSLSDVIAENHGRFFELVKHGSRHHLGSDLPAIAPG